MIRLRRATAPRAARPARASTPADPGVNHRFIVHQPAVGRAVYISEASLALTVGSPGSQFGALGLVVNAIVAWNSRRMSAPRHQLRNKGSMPRRCRQSILIARARPHQPARPLPIHRSRPPAATSKPSEAPLFPTLYGHPARSLRPRDSRGGRPSRGRVELYRDRVPTAARYADAFGVDLGRWGCWRSVYADGGHGRPGRCPGQADLPRVSRTTSFVLSSCFLVAGVGFAGCLVAQTRVQSFGVVPAVDVGGDVPDRVRTRRVDGAVDTLILEGREE